VIRTPVTVRRVSVPGHNEPDVHFSGTSHDFVKVLHLEPQQYAVSVRLVIGVADGTMMVLNSELMQLKNNLAVPDQLFVLRAAMVALATQQTLIPSAARFHIGDGDEGLRTH